MDMGLRDRTALVCGASQGLGRACALALAREGVRITIAARTHDTLAAAAREIEADAGMPVTAVACDVTTEAGRAAALAALPSPDIVVTNAGGPPPGDFRDWGRDAWLAAIDANMLAPIELIKATVDAMIRRRFGRIINITSSAVKSPIDVLGLSNGARSGLTGFVAGLARTTVRHNVTINNLLPGTFETARMAKVFDARAMRSGVTPAEMRRREAEAAPAGRFGRPEEFGAACVWLASVHAGYVTGQNLLLDGGAYPGIF